jgi:alpha-L-fucosidase
VLQYKAKFPDGVAVLDIERGKLDDIRPHYWQTDTSVSCRSWGYIEDDEFKSVTSAVHDLVDIVSENGNLLLNVGPRPDGTIPQQAADVLLGLGEWLHVNGEAVYGTRHWQAYGEGPTGVPQSFRERDQAADTAEDIRFTVKGNALYATCLGWPGSEYTIQSLALGGRLTEDITNVTMLGVETPRSRDERGLTIHTPAERLCKHAYVLKMTVT